MAACRALLTPRTSSTAAGGFSGDMHRSQLLVALSHLLLTTQWTEHNLLSLGCPASLPALPRRVGCARDAAVRGVRRAGGRVLIWRGELRGAAAGCPAEGHTACRVPGGSTLQGAGSSVCDTLLSLACTPLPPPPPRPALSVAGAVGVPDWPAALARAAPHAGAGALPGAARQPCHACQLDGHSTSISLIFTPLPAVAAHLRTLPALQPAGCGHRGVPGRAAADRRPAG